MTYHREGIEYIKISGYLIVNEQNLPRDNTHGWYCNNELSMYYTDQTEYKDVCDDFERRENAKPKQW